MKLLVGGFLPSDETACLQLERLVRAYGHEAKALSLLVITPDDVIHADALLAFTVAGEAERERMDSLRLKLGNNMLNLKAVALGRGVPCIQVQRHDAMAPSIFASHTLKANRLDKFFSIDLAGAVDHAVSGLLDVARGLYEEFELKHRRPLLAAAYLAAGLALLKGPTKEEPR